jgi:hypothetical protein
MLLNVSTVQDMPSLYFALLNIRGMLRKAMAVEECDATEALCLFYCRAHKKICTNLKSAIRITSQNLCPAQYPGEYFLQQGMCVLRFQELSFVCHRAAKFQENEKQLLFHPHGVAQLS